MAYVLWDRFLKHNPKDPTWPNRDRFILSPCHASALLYSLLHLTGYDLPMDELKRFRQWGSKTPGQPTLGQCHADSVAKSLSQRAGGGFNSWS
jgi:transketolase